MAYLDKIETRIAGIPCLIGVTSYGSPAYTAGAPENLTAEIPKTL